MALSQWRCKESAPATRRAASDRYRAGEPEIGWWLAAGTEWENRLRYLAPPRWNYGDESTTSRTITRAVRYSSLCPIFAKYGVCDDTELDRKKLLPNAAGKVCCVSSGRGHAHLTLRWPAAPSPHSMSPCQIQPMVTAHDETHFPLRRLATLNPYEVIAPSQRQGRRLHPDFYRQASCSCDGIAVARYHSTTPHMENWSRFAAAQILGMTRAAFIVASDCFCRDRSRLVRLGRFASTKNYVHASCNRRHQSTCP